jgi:flagellar hook protein FlgE
LSDSIPGGLEALRFIPAWTPPFANLRRFGMLRSLFSGISGLRSHQTMMDVVANNIANVNTTGFKSSNVIFEDTLSQIIRSAGAPGAGIGGTNPAQVGLGVQVGAIQTNFLQGSAQTTNKPTDLLIQGDGFFVLKDGNEQVYSRAGAFTFDTDGYLVNSDGNYVQGFPAVNGVVDVYGTPTDVRLQVGATIASTPTTDIGVGGNIKADNTNPLTLSATAYDIKGAGHPLSIAMTWNGTDGYDIDVLDQTENPPASVGTGSVTFLPSGSPNLPATMQATLPDGSVIDIDLEGLTNYNGVESVAVKTSNGAAAGSLQQFQIAPNGTVIGIYSNGVKRNEAQIALANFNNPGGLERLGDTTFRSSPNSGLAQVGVAGTGGRGVLQSGTLEMSNVDLGMEFTNLIIAQRGFSANSRVITTSDEMLQELVNIKR